MKPNTATFTNILLACDMMGALVEGMNIHQRVVGNGFSLNAIVVNTLIDMDVKCGIIYKAWNFFEKMCDAKMISWIAIIVGYMQNGYIERVCIKIFMEDKNITFRSTH